MRSYHYFPYLKKDGFEITVKPFFDDAYLKDLYDGKKNITSVVKSYVRRFFVLFSVGQFDRVVIEKEIFPYLPAFAERLLHIFGVRYIVDYDDAIFHNYDQNANPYFKLFLKKKIDKVMRLSQTVVAGNSYLAEKAKDAGAKNTEIIPTVIDLERYSIKSDSVSENKKFIVGWIGTKTTFEKHLLPCKNWIQKIHALESEIEFHIVGIPEDQDFGHHVKWIPWKEETEVSEIRKMDVGIMPLQDSLWEKGKCAYKLIQYAACGVPGIASDVGMNHEVTIPHQTGFLANTTDEWISRILELKKNPLKRIELGANAQKLVEEKYCIQVTAKKWMKLLQVN